MTRGYLMVSFLLLLPALAPALPATTDVLMWSADDPFAAGSTVAVDFGAELTGTTTLEAVVSGMGGVQRWTIYQGVENPTGEVAFEMFLDCAEGGSALAGAQRWLPILAPFDGDVAFAPAAGWEFLNDGRCDLTVTYVHGPFPDNPFCYGTGYTAPVIDHVDLIVTCTRIVATAPSSWGAVKSLFR